MKQKSTFNFFNNISSGDVPEMDQLLFIKESTNFESDRLKALVNDVDMYLDQILSKKEIYLDPELILQKIEDYKDQSKEIPFRNFPNSDFNKAFISGHPVQGIPRYGKILDIGGMFFVKETYNIRLFRFILIEELKKVEDKNRTNLLTEDEIPLDISNTKATEKIVYLNELGIIDLLRSQKPFEDSVNRLATILSAITDENVTTLQPVLNALLARTNSEEKNPYNSKSQKTIQKVKSQLIAIGFKIKKQELPE